MQIRGGGKADRRGRERRGEIKYREEQTERERKNKYSTNTVFTMILMSVHNENTAYKSYR